MEKTYEIISKPGCVFCDKAKACLDELGLPYAEKILGADISKAELLRRVPGASTVPQIFLDNELIGGWENMKSHLMVSGYEYDING